MTIIISIDICTLEFALMVLLLYALYCTHPLIDRVPNHEEPLFGKQRGDNGVGTERTFPPFSRRVSLSPLPKRSVTVSRHFAFPHCSREWSPNEGVCAWQARQSN